MSDPILRQDVQVAVDALDAATAHMQAAMDGVNAIWRRGGYGIAEILAMRKALERARRPTR